MHSLKTPSLLAFIMIVGIQAITAFAADNTVLEVQKHGGFSYVSGGIGSEEIDELMTLQKNYNLRISNTDKTGHYSGEVRVVISDYKQHKLFEANGGPIFLTNMPKGEYLMEAFNEGKIQKQAFVITADKPTRVQFRW